MSDVNKPEANEFNEADSKADTIALFCLIMIAVGAALFFISR